MLLHGGVCAVQERPIEAATVSYIFPLSFKRPIGDNKRWDSPCCGALFRGVAEEETELLQTLGECVFGRHGGIGF